MDESSGVGVVDKSVRVLAAVEQGPVSLSGLVARTGLARPTAYRLAVALEAHRLLVRDSEGRFILGPRIGELARSVAMADPLMAAAPGVLQRLRDKTGESAQLYRRDGDIRRCVAAAERTAGLRDTVPVGAALEMTAGSAAQVLLAWESLDAEPGIVDRAKFTLATLGLVRRRGWAQSVGEREAGLASVSAPVFGPGGRVLAAISVSGPIVRLTRSPGRLHAPTVMAAGQALGRLAGGPAGRPAG